MYVNEQVMHNRLRTVSKTGRAEMNFFMHPHHQQSTGEDGRVTEE